jgi:hypothetical protein
MRLESFSRLLKESCIIELLVAGDTPPVHCFSSSIRIGKAFDDIIVPALRLIPLLPGKCRVREAEHELGKKIVGRQKALELMSFGTIGIQNLDRRRPLRAKARKGFWLLLDMYLYRKIVLNDKFLDTRIGVNIGIQPGATASHGRCVKIQQQDSPARPCFCQRGICILPPCDRHDYFLSGKPYVSESEALSLHEGGCRGRIAIRDLSGLVLEYISQIQLI